MDRRVKKTRKALQEALIALILEKGYEAITVQDVLERADVGRSTFYAHFYDLEDLLQSEFEILQAEFEQHLSKQAAPPSIWELSRLMFQHAESYKRLYKAVVGKESGRIINATLHQYLSRQIHESLAHESKNEIVPLELLEHYLVSSFMALLSYWLDRNAPYSAEEMAVMYARLVKDGIDRL